MLHALIAIGFLVLAIGSGMDRFDTGAPPSSLESGVDAAARVLMLPLSLVWNQWMSEHLPDVFEWLLLVVNSAIWGFGATSLLMLFAVRIQRRRRLAQ